MRADILRFLSLSDVNVQFVLLGSLLLGVTGGLLGSFALLRKRSLMGDALAHAALPGVVIAFLITGSKSIGPLLVGASISGIVGVLLVQAIVQKSRIKPDAALGLVLTVFFGAGIVLLTHVQRQPIGNQSGLDKFLFGQAASLVSEDLWVMGAISLTVLLFVVLFFKEFRLLCFDADYLTSLGFNAKRIDLLLMGLLVLAVMVGLQAVGVVLMAAMLITPAAAARFWTNRLNGMAIAAAIFGGISGVAGTFVSALAPRVPTGPVMVLTATFLFVVSAVAAPKRGLLAKWRLHQTNQQQVAEQHVLRACIELQEQHPDLALCSFDELIQHVDDSPAHVRRTIKSLSKKKNVQITDNAVSLTTKGQLEALHIVKTHRLWEHYLVHRARLRPDHVHRDADEMEHILSKRVLDELEKILKSQGIDTEKIVNIHG